MIERLQRRKPLALLRLGKQDGITAEAFYDRCAASIQQQDNVGRVDLFAVDKDAQRNPPTHRLLRLELLSWVSERPNKLPHFSDPTKALSVGATEMLAFVWRHAKWMGSWTAVKVSVTKKNWPLGMGLLACKQAVWKRDL